MDTEVTRILLEGITAKEFVIIFLVGIAGILVRFLVNLVNGIRYDPNTDTKFRFKYFIKGLVRLLVSFTVMAAVVARFQEFSYLLVDININSAYLAAQGHEAVAGITPGSAFLIGLGIDEVVKRFVKEGDKQIKNIVIKRNGG